MEDIAYKKLYYCHMCRKTIELEFVESHKALGHQVLVYMGMPEIVKIEEKK